MQLINGFHVRFVKKYHVRPSVRRPSSVYVSSIALRKKLVTYDRHEMLILCRVLQTN